MQVFESESSRANLNEGLQLGKDRCLVMAIAEQDGPRGVQGSCLSLQGSVGFLPTVREVVASQARERATKKKTDAASRGLEDGDQDAMERRNIAFLHSGRMVLLLSHPDGGSYRPPTREKLRVNRTGAFCQALQGG
jgi:hypothetical protein